MGCGTHNVKSAGGLWDHCGKVDPQDQIISARESPCIEEAVRPRTMFCSDSGHSCHYRQVPISYRASFVRCRSCARAAICRQLSCSRGGYSSTSLSYRIEMDDKSRSVPVKIQRSSRLASWRNLSFRSCCSPIWWCSLRTWKSKKKMFRCSHWTIMIIVLLLNE